MITTNAIPVSYGSKSGTQDRETIKRSFDDCRIVLKISAVLAVLPAIRAFCIDKNFHYVNVLQY